MGMGQPSSWNPRKNWVGPSLADSGVVGDMSSNIVPSWIEVLRFDEISFSEEWTGTPTGSFKMRFSNADKRPADETEGIDSGDTGWDNPAAGAGDNFWTVNLKERRAKWMLRWYDASSGSGALVQRATARGR